MIAKTLSVFIHYDIEYISADIVKTIKRIIFGNEFICGDYGRE